jgi:hypothetical protein
MAIDPQGSFDWLLGTAREKYTLAEVSRILSSDAGNPVSTQAVLNAIESGNSARCACRSRPLPGRSSANRVQWVSRIDLLATCCATRA